MYLVNDLKILLNNVIKRIKNIDNEVEFLKYLDNYKNDRDLLRIHDIMKNEIDINFLSKTHLG